MSVPAQRYVDYYRSILKRIADGWDSPVTLASLALEWTLHDEGCSFNKGDFGECDCSAEALAVAKNWYSLHDSLKLREVSEPIKTPPNIGEVKS